MNDANRDLLVLSSATRHNPEEMERELDFLNTLLFHIENWETFSIANELIDINNHRIIRKTHHIQKVLSEKNVKAFVFTCNKN